MPPRGGAGSSARHRAIAPRVPAAASNQENPVASRTAGRPPRIREFFGVLLPDLIRTRPVWAVGLVAVIGFATYTNSLGNPYQSYPLDVSLYRPVTTLTYALNYAIGGLDPWGYHLVNVLLHAANSALIYLLLRTLSESRGLALVTAIAFAVRPIHTDAVANVAGRADLLACGFLVGAWLLALREDRAGGGRRGAYLAGSVALFEEAVRLNPTYPKARYASGVVLAQQWRTEEARRAFERAGVRAPHLPTARDASDGDKAGAAIR